MAKRTSTNSGATASTRRGPIDSAARPGSGETRERILRAAHTLFRERGYEGTAVSMLASAAGVTTPALYWHFKDKAEVCGEMLKRDYVSDLTEIVERTVGDTAEARLRAFVSAFVDQQLRAVELERNFAYRQLRAFATEEARKEIEDLEREFFEFLRTILKDGQAAGDFAISDVTATAMAIGTMCEYVFVWFRRDGRLSSAQLGQIYSDLAVGMVRAEREA
jgi:AcrR family transcriptional regulator